MMLEVIIACEGQTEREFCRSVLKPYLASKGINLSGKLVGKPGNRRSGIRPWNTYRDDMIRTARENPLRHVGFLVDYYGMPISWPGRAEAENATILDRGKKVEVAVRVNLDSLGSRFHPCVQLHEFEALLFVNPEITALSLSIAAPYLDHETIADQLAKIKEQSQGNVEQINDSVSNAPSKRLRKIVPGYDKVAYGVTCTSDVTVDALRLGCPWLNRWLSEIESLIVE